jgi:hypothetical protein
VIVGDAGALLDFFRLLSRAVPTILSWYRGEQVLYVMALLGVMGWIGVQAAKAVPLPPIGADIIGWAIGGALLGSFWEVPIYVLRDYFETLMEFLSLGRIVEGAIFGAVCGLAWHGAGQLKRAPAAVAS